MEQLLSIAAIIAFLILLRHLLKNKNSIDPYIQTPYNKVYNTTGITDRQLDAFRGELRRLEPNNSIRTITRLSNNSETRALEVLHDFNKNEKVTAKVSSSWMIDNTFYYMIVGNTCYLLHVATKMYED